MKRAIMFGIGLTSVATCSVGLALFLVFGMGEVIGERLHVVAFRLQAAATPVNAAGVVSPLAAAEIEARIRVAEEREATEQLRQASAEAAAAETFAARPAKRGR